jgi:hypothetical protein
MKHEVWKNYRKNSKIKSSISCWKNVIKNIKEKMLLKNEGVRGLIR